MFDDKETQDAFVKELVRQQIIEIMEEEVAKGNFEYDPEADVYRRVRRDQAEDE